MIIGVLYGGISTEKNISIDTAYTFMQWINYDKYSVVPIYINEYNEWNMGEERKQPLNKKELKFSSLGQKNSDNLDGKVDIIVPLLNGIGGEDGSVQGILETLNIPYTGCGIEASAIGMNKILTKRILKSTGIPMVKDIVVNKKSWISKQECITKKIKENLKFPLIIKPARLGSSIGIVKINNEDELLLGINEALMYDHDIIVEEFIKCREILISILQRKEELFISVPGEVITRNQFYSYEDKYSESSTATKIIAELDSLTMEKIEVYSREIFETLNARGLLRIDFFYDEQNTILVNEVNTVPSLGGTSVYPYLLKESGIKEQDIVENLIKTGIYYHEVKNSLEYNY